MPLLGRFSEFCLFIFIVPIVWPIHVGRSGRSNALIHIVVCVLVAARVLHIHALNASLHSPNK